MKAIALMIFGALLCGLGSGMVLTVNLMRLYPETTTVYQQGQIDALNGKVLFELVKQPDGSMVWQKKTTP